MKKISIMCLMVGVSLFAQERPNILEDYKLIINLINETNDATVKLKDNQLILNNRLKFVEQNLSLQKNELSNLIEQNKIISANRLSNNQNYENLSSDLRLELLKNLSNEDESN